MRSIRRELESQRDALTNRISTSTRSTQDDDHRREIFKDPFGMASITHDDEVVAAVVDTRARQVEEIDRALADIDAGRYGICRECGEDTVLDPRRIGIARDLIGRNRRVRGVLRHQPGVPIPAHEGLDRRLAVDHRGHDLTVATRCVGCQGRLETGLGRAA